LGFSLPVSWEVDLDCQMVWLRNNVTLQAGQFVGALCRGAEGLAFQLGGVGCLASTALRGQAHSLAAVDGGR